MKKIIIVSYSLFIFLLIPSISNAEYLGCFEPSETVYATVQFNDSTGDVAATSVAARVYDPNDTTTPTATPTMSAVDGTNAIGLFRGSFSVGASPLQGTWTIRYNGTIDSNVWAGSDTFDVMDVSGECATRGTVTVGSINTDVITATSIQAGAITASEAPNLDAAVSTRLATSSFPGDLKWAVYQIVDLTNEGGDQNPTTTSSDTNITTALDFTATNPQPILYFPTTTEESTQQSYCNLQGFRTTITNYNTTTKVITHTALPVAPDYRCVFRIY